MSPHKMIFLTILATICLHDEISAQPKPRSTRVGVVVDERLSALRSTPDLSGKLVRRIGRGRSVAIRGSKKNADGIVFYRVSVSSRTHGWIQREAIVSAGQKDDDIRLVSLVTSSYGFDRIARIRIFLDLFQRSSLRPQMLLLLGETAEELSAKLSRDAARRIVIPHGSATPESSYYLNFQALDRFNRQGIRFVFDLKAKSFHYDGAAWRELIRRHPTTVEADRARMLLRELDRINEVTRK